MKKIKLFLIIALISVSGISNAQKRHQHAADKEKIKAERVAFITAELELSVEEAQNFWPVFNEYERKNEEFLNEEREITRELRNSADKISDNELEKKLDRINEIQVQKAELQTEYFNKFKSVLSIKKLAKLQANEREFRRKLLHNYGRCYGKDGK
ncbi:MAG: hypothetical protein GX879_02895 [Bacteroidales bacterium]|nr:hypothetical protein [Bacteroidales bacterium]